MPFIFCMLLLFIGCGGETKTVHRTGNPGPSESPSPEPTPEPRPIRGVDINQYLAGKPNPPRYEDAWETGLRVQGFTAEEMPFLSGRVLLIEGERRRDTMFWEKTGDGTLCTVYVEVVSNGTYFASTATCESI